MKIIFFGSPEFAVPSLKVLAKIPDIEIQAVISQEQAGAVKNAAKELNLPVFTPKNQEDLKKILSNYRSDFYIVIAFGMILDKEVLQKPKIAAINIHGSLLPKYRGASPIQESLLNGDRETGITIMKMDEKLDHGDIYLLRRMPIEKNDDAISLGQKLANLSALILPLTLTDIYEGNLQPITQNHSKASYCHKISKEDGNIDWKRGSREILNMIKAYKPWPSAFTYFDGKILKISQAEIDNEKIPAGELKIVDKKELKIGNGDGSLKLKKVQIEGKKELNIIDFINGNLQKLQNKAKVNNFPEK